MTSDTIEVHYQIVAFLYSYKIRTKRQGMQKIVVDLIINIIV